MFSLKVHFAQNPGGVTNGKSSSYLSVPKFSNQVTDEGMSTAVSSLPSYQQRLSVSRSGVYPELGTINEESRVMNGYSDVTLVPVDSRSVSPTQEPPQSKRIVIQDAKIGIKDEETSKMDRESPEDCSQVDEGRNTVNIKDTQPLLGMRTNKESNQI